MSRVDAIAGPTRSGLLATAVRGHAFVPEHPLVDGAVSLLVGKDEAVPQIVDAIRGARRSVEAAEYILRPSSDGREILEAMRATSLARRGGERVDVALLADRQGSSQFPFMPARRYYDGLERDGVRVAIHRGPLNPFAGGVDHRKLFVIDGNLAFVGGMGFGTGTTRHDVMLRLEGPIAAQAHAQFVGRWVDTGGGVSAVQRALLTEADDAGQHAVETGSRLVSNTPGGQLQATAAIEAIARTARERLWVHTPYFHAPNLADALEGAARAQLDTMLAVNGDASAFPLFPMLSRTSYRQLLEGGGDAMRIIEQRQMSHQKIVLNESWLTAGSTNASPRAMYLDHELNVVTNVAAARGQAAAMMALDELRGVRVTRADLESPWTRVAGTRLGAALLERSLGTLA